MALNRRPTVTVAGLALAGMAITIGGCTSAPRAFRPTGVPSTTAASLARCPDAQVHGLLPNEVGAAGDGATLFGLVQATARPVRAGDAVKIVWRMTGKGPATFTAFDPDGTPRPLAWGPEARGGQGASNYHRPGSEWGVGYEFAMAGCWRLHAERTVGSADIWLTVRP